MSLEKRRQLGQNGHSYAMKEFGRSQLMNRMEALLSEAMTLAQGKVPKVLTP